MSKICRYCGDPIDMDDYRAYTIVQHEDETAITVYLHASCIDMDENNWMMKTLESYSILKGTESEEMLRNERESDVYTGDEED